MKKTICEKGGDDVSSGVFRSSETNVRTAGVPLIVPEDECNSSSSSSIGDDSDADREDVAESRYGFDRKNDNNNSFDDAIQALEQTLPIRLRNVCYDHTELEISVKMQFVFMWFYAEKSTCVLVIVAKNKQGRKLIWSPNHNSANCRRGISSFYNGKSKSFACLGNVWPTTSSVQDIAKPENAYTRKRRNLGAFKLSNINTRRICKKPKTSKLSFTIEREEHDFTTCATRPQINRPLALRSFSLVNLH